MDNSDEILDIVNDNDEVVGTIVRGDVPALEFGSNKYVRAVGVFLINHGNEVWIPTRSKLKRLLPGALDASCSEHVSSGEDYKEASVRGLAEELNIHIESSQLVNIGKIHPTEDMIYFHEIFILPFDNEPEYNEDDYESGAWHSLKELKEALENGASAKNFLPEAVQLLLKYVRSKQ